MIEDRIVLLEKTYAKGLEIRSLIPWLAAFSLIEVQVNQPMLPKLLQKE